MSGVIEEASPSGHRCATESALSCCLPVFNVQHYNVSTMTKIHIFSSTACTFLEPAKAISKMKLPVYIPWISSPRPSTKCAHSRPPKDFKSPLRKLPPELRQMILYETLTEPCLAHVVFSSICNPNSRGLSFPSPSPSEPCSPSEEKDKGRIKRLKHLKTALKTTSFIKAFYIADWKLLSLLFGGEHDLDVLLEHAWRMLAREGVEVGMLEILEEDGQYHRRGCRGACRSVESDDRRWRWTLWLQPRTENRKTLGSIFCF